MSEKEQTNEKQSSPKTLLEGVSILLVDDDEGILSSLSRLLGKRGANVQTANSGSKAIKVALTTNIDAAIIDLGLPDMTGHQVAKELRTQGFQKALIAFSGRDNDEIIEQSKEAGFNFHLVKPASLQDIIDVLLATLNM